MSDFRVTREYRCAYWASSFETDPFFLGSPMVYRLSGNTGSTDTVISASNPGPASVNFLLEFYESIASNTAVYPTWRSPVFGQVGQLQPGSSPAAWLNFSTKSRRTNLMRDNIFPRMGTAADSGKYYYWWEKDGWWRILSDGDLSVNGFVQSGSQSFGLTIQSMDHGRDMGSNVYTELQTFPPAMPLPDVEEERTRIEGAKPPRSLPVFTPSTIDDPENEVVVTYQRDSSVALDKCVLTLRNPRRVTLKKLLRFGPHDVITSKPLFQPQVTQASTVVDLSTIAGKKMELWQAGALWFDYKKYEIAVDNADLLGGGNLTVDWNRDWPR